MFGGEKAPHPNPLPEGEGTEWGMLKKYADLNVLHRIHNRLVLSGRCTRTWPACSESIFDSFFQVDG
ncbi:hypothetical protein EMIT0P265_20290 [Pseudomonas zeae]